ncbi:MAG: DNA-binding protein [Rudaea sp.]|nr:DNA-binding protein [Rudaea sp.]
MRANQLAALKRRAKENIRASGITIKQWAEKNSFNPDHVYHVLNNADVKAHWGETHRIAVALGIKPAA